ncbi:MAG: sensor histidine kinase [Eubacterium sp.]|nr:sensor histidine kinase [Eubacterium sp.]MCM1215562.1 sensor histidine kinase [Lachnospiraceae bacterium]MCM1239358.1 sensor histidine kinase [Lachnospiraceae bacterium]
MDPEIYNLLSEIISELRQDRNSIDEKLRDNICHIKEAEVYAETFLGSEPEEDIKVFSPRNIDSVYRNEIKDIENRKSRYEEENKFLTEKRDAVSARIEQIEQILENGIDNLSVLKIQEEDRKRIAIDLHDTSLQNLTHLIHQIELSGLYIDKDPLRAKIELSIVNKRLKEIIEEIRNTIYDLRPMTFDDLGLKAAIERFVDSINEDRKYKVELELEDVSCETNIILVTIYRIVQECLNNIVKHAEATRISLKCKCRNSNCYIFISDDGKGFNKNDYNKERHFGIYCIKERVKLLGGKIKLDSIPERGTIISISIPLG